MLQIFDRRLWVSLWLTHCPSDTDTMQKCAHILFSIPNLVDTLLIFRQSCCNVVLYQGSNIISSTSCFSHCQTKTLKSFWTNCWNYSYLQKKTITILILTWLYLASQDALEVMWVTESVSQWWLADFTDVTLASEDSNWRLFWCCSGKLSYEKLLSSL